MNNEEKQVEASFWHQRWENDKIGFHLGQVNPYLVQYWPELGLHAGSRIFVPLCGKSLDLEWLLREGYQVTGIEISPRAIEAFFAENALPEYYANAGPEEPRPNRQSLLVVDSPDAAAMCGQRRIDDEALEDVVAGLPAGVELRELGGFSSDFNVESAGCTVRVRYSVTVVSSGWIMGR